MKLTKLFVTTAVLSALSVPMINVHADSVDQNNVPPQSAISTSTPKIQSTKSHRSHKKHYIKRYHTKHTTINPTIATTTSNRGFYTQPTSQSESGAAPWQTLGNNPYHLALHDGNQIYYNNQASQNNYAVIQAAVDAWNQLGVIKLVPTDAANAEIILNDDVTPEATRAAGVTQYAPYYADTGQVAGVVKSSLTPYCDNKATDYRTAVMEHEIGHALGFAHDTDVYTSDDNETQATHVMYPSICNGGYKVIPLGNLEANALRTYYGL